MSSGFLAIIILTLGSGVAFYIGKIRALWHAKGNQRKLHSRLPYYGSFNLIAFLLPTLVVIMLWIAVQPGLITMVVRQNLPADIQALPQDRLNLFMSEIIRLADTESAVVISDQVKQQAVILYRDLDRMGSMWLWITACLVGLFGLGAAQIKIQPQFRARNWVERLLLWMFGLCAALAVLVTFGIIASQIFESLRFFDQIPLTDFLFGVHWSPQVAIRTGQVASEGSFGAVPLFTGTLLIATISMLVAVPIGLMAAIYLSDYASPRLRVIAKPVLEILAGIPTVVYGFFAALTVMPALRDFGGNFGLEIRSESALAAGLVMGIMIIPLVSSLSDDVINAVPNILREGAYGLGATKSECLKTVVLPAALPGIFAALLLAISRAIGETMIVVMAAGQTARLTANPLESVTTVTVQIVTLLTGDQEFDSTKTLAAFALGLVLFAVTLIMNIIALRVVQKYREKYE